MPDLRLYNTLTRSKELFRRRKPPHVGMYVCGPTVYDFAHIGNARPAIVFDVLFRLLRHEYGAANVTYVRNLTDVDDKINARAARDFPGLALNEAIRRVTETTAAQYERDVAALGCLQPSEQPRATEHIDGMIRIIQLLLDRGHAYVARGEEGREALFDVRSMSDYGALSHRRLEEQQAGARIEVKDHKRNPGDFVLWKESGADEPGWDAEFRLKEENREALLLNDTLIGIRGRPGWHIECSAMSDAYLGPEFDIHGGGLDLIFPHHENEIAQSRCAHGTKGMASVWMHNGFLQVEGRKMSKSEGNFFTIDELLNTERFGGRRWDGGVLRLAMLMTHYREPIDFSIRRLEEALTEYRWYERVPRLGHLPEDGQILPTVLEALCDDLNTPKALSVLRRSGGNLADVAATLNFLGIYGEREFGVPRATRKQHRANISEAVERAYAQQALKGLNLDENRMASLVDRRLDLIRQKNWPEADRIRDELLAQGIQLKDGKDPATGERVTTWEVKR